MFEYRVTYRIDSEEHFTVNSFVIGGESVEELFGVIKEIEKRNTIISIKNNDLKLHGD